MEISVPRESSEYCFPGELGSTECQISNAGGEDRARFCAAKWTGFAAGGRRKWREVLGYFQLRRFKMEVHFAATGLILQQLVYQAGRSHAKALRREGKVASRTCYSSASSSSVHIITFYSTAILGRGVVGSSIRELAIRQTTGSPPELGMPERYF